MVVEEVDGVEEVLGFGNSVDGGGEPGSVSGSFVGGGALPDVYAGAVWIPMAVMEPFWWERVTS